MMYHLHNEDDVSPLAHYIGSMILQTVAVRWAQEWFEENGVTVLPWPALSSDINLIEHIWDMLDRKVCSHHHLPSNLDAL